MSQKESSVKIEREAQTPQKPSARTGDNQDNRVPTGVGSLLGKPQTAGETESNTPHLNK